MSAKVLVSGASGYVASHVVQKLQVEGYMVRGTVRSLQNQEKIQHLYTICPNAKHRLELVEADLTKPETWGPAVAGMDYVIHTASPIPLAAPKTEDELIKPAVGGTLAVLRACASAPSVKRVVLTSSCASIDFGEQTVEESKRIKSENDWTDTSKKVQAYAKSKTLAEKAAWDFVSNLTDSDNRFELAVVNPSVIMGPPLQKSSCTSVDILKMFLEHQLPRTPRIQMPIVDVRDVAAAHVKAMTLPEAAGHRHICTTQSLWMKDIALVLDSVFKSQGYRLPTSPMGDCMLWLAKFFSSDAAIMYSELHTEHHYDTRRLREVLKINPYDVRDTIIEMAYALIETGFVKKTKQYRGRGGPEERQRYMNVQLEN